MLYTTEIPENGMLTEITLQKKIEVRELGLNTENLTLSVGDTQRLHLLEEMDEGAEYRCEVNVK